MWRQLMFMCRTGCRLRTVSRAHHSGQDLLVNITHLMFTISELLSVPRFIMISLQLSSDRRDNHASIGTTWSHCRSLWSSQFCAYVAWLLCLRCHDQPTINVHQLLFVCLTPWLRGYTKTAPTKTAPKILVPKKLSKTAHCVVQNGPSYNQNGP